MNKPDAKAIALLPILVFLILYLGLGILFEYVFDISMGFYSIPIVVPFLMAILVACLQNKSLAFDDKLQVMADGVGDKNILIMILIFLIAGLFVGITGRSSAEAVAYFLLSIIPSKFAVPMLFVIACFISVAMGTSVGTITLVTPIAAAISVNSGISLPLCVATVIGGAMFGDNLSFISDTTIAACTTQGCEMKDKFRENFKIAFPAAIASMTILVIISLNTPIQTVPTGAHKLILVVPYVQVLVTALLGMNVFLVLLIATISGGILSLATGSVSFMELLENIGSGVSGMFETIMVTILVAALCGCIRAYGGFEALLSWIRKIFKGDKGGQLGVGFLVGLMDIATANNTVAIVMAAPIAKEISKEYGISGRKTASLLDTFSCIIQGIIPYGAQMLVAISACASAGLTVSAFDIIPFLFYPMFLLLSSLVFIFFGKKGNN